ncbi:DNA ligase, partial [Helicosporidium sp. ATCC 50920]
SKAPAPSAALKAAMASLKSTGVGAEAVRLAAQHGSFDVSAAATWRAGQAAPFSFLTDAFEAIAAESKRLSIASILTGAFRTLLARAEADLLPAVYLCTNRVAPAHEALELGLGDATLVKALAQATGRKEASVRAEYGACGDLGSVAAAARGMQKTMFPPPALTIRGVFAAFREIAAAEGQGSQDRKKALIAKLLVAARGNEAGYVMRALQGRLRIGLAEQTVLVALAHAVALRGVGGAGGEGGTGEEGR